MKTEILMAQRQQAEQALGESEQRYRRLLAATTDYIYTVKVHEGRTTETSHGPGCVAVTGYTSAEFAEDSFLWYRVVHEEDREAVLAQANRILAGELPPPLEHRLIHKHGEVRWVRNTTIPHHDAQGQLVAYDGLISDITGTKHAELLLSAEYTTTRDLSEADGLADAMPRILEHLCQILQWNHAAYWRGEQEQLKCEACVWRFPLRAFGLTQSSGGRMLEKGSGLPGRVYSSGQPLWLADVAAVPELATTSPPAQAGLHCGCAFPIRINRHVLGVVELYSRESLGIDNRMLEVLCTIGAYIGQFIEQKRAEKRLEHERKLLRTLVDNLPDCIFVKDADSRFLLNNAAHLQMLGCTQPQDAHGKTDFDYFPAELAARYRADEESILRSGQPMQNQEEPVVDRQGRSYWFLSTKVPLRDCTGKAIGLVGICRDITERRRAAQQLEHAYARLARRGLILKTIVRQLQASHKELKSMQLQLIQAAKLESLGTLAAGVAHEVKNPLQTILLGVDYLTSRFPQPDPDLTLVLQDMREAIERATSIIREMLNLAADTEINWVRADVNQVIERSLLLVRNELIASHIVLEQELSSSLPPLPIDLQKLQQVFLNIFINSIQAMEDGGTLRVRSVLLSLDAQRRRDPFFRKFHGCEQVVTVEVEDTGPGLTDEVLRNIWDPFFTTKAVGKGTGLGLSVARKIIDLHGGNINIKNGPRGGALVTIALKV